MLSLPRFVPRPLFYSMAYALGYRHFDSAVRYGTTPRLTHWLQKKEDAYLIDKHAPIDSKVSVAQMKNERSVHTRNCSVQPWSYLLHSVNSTYITEEAISFMKGVKESGIPFIGFSADNPSQIPDDFSWVDSIAVDSKLLSLSAIQSADLSQKVLLVFGVFRNGQGIDSVVDECLGLINANKNLRVGLMCGSRKPWRLYELARRIRKASFAE